MLKDSGYSLIFCFQASTPMTGHVKPLGPFISYPTDQTWKLNGASISQSMKIRLLASSSPLFLHQSFMGSIGFRWEENLSLFHSLRILLNPATILDVDRWNWWRLISAKLCRSSETKRKFLGSKVNPHPHSEFLDVKQTNRCTLNFRVNFSAPLLSILSNFLLFPPTVERHKTRLSWELRQPQINHGWKILLTF